MAKKKVSDIFDLEGLAQAFGLKADLADFMEDNIDLVQTSAGWAYKEAIKEGKTERQAEKALEKAEKKTYDEMGKAYIAAIFDTIEKEAEKFHLTVIQQKPNRYKVVPTTDWKTSLKEIIDTINGVGMFEFNSIKEFLESGPYTLREGVLTHLHYLEDYGRVYGGSTLQRQFEKNLEHYTRNL